MVYNSSYSGGGVVCPDPSSGGEEVYLALPNRRKDQRCCGPDRSYNEGDETGQGEPTSQSPPRSSGRGSEETVSMPRKRKKPKDHNKEGRQI